VALVNCLGFLRWLRAGEVFMLQWMDIAILAPDEVDAYDFPPGVGAVLLDLLHQTKAVRAKRANVILACQTFSGFKLGRWFQHLWHELGEPDAEAYIFQSSNGVHWTSHHFRHHYLYPF
jgi:hypothetical protein